jgi:hypothetical protein
MANPATHLFRLYVVIKRFKYHHASSNAKHMSLLAFMKADSSWDPFTDTDTYLNVILLYHFEVNSSLSRHN